MDTLAYPKRLIEVDLPIARISAHARREKSIRHGHISTLHIWWARRPLAACRAVICASLWPDPVDLSTWAKRGDEVPVGDGSVIIRPRRFLDTARERMLAWGKEHLGKVSRESSSRFIAIQKGNNILADPWDLQRTLLDFIADFANWDNSTDKDYLETARVLTQAAHEALGGELETRPLVVDPFAGGGSIPLEALRVGADAFASDLNPIPVLLNKVVLEYIPKYGQRLADEVRKWGAWIKQEAEKELAEFYPKDPDGATPIAYLWARTIQCEGPGCGAEVPLMRSLWLAKKGKRSVALRIVPKPQEKRVDFEIIENAKTGEERLGTVKRGSATCPCCGYTTPVANVRKQFRARCGGTNDARFLCVISTKKGEQGRFYRVPNSKDESAAFGAKAELERIKNKHKGTISLLPDEKIDIRGIRHTWAMIYGINNWSHCFTSRQALVLVKLFDLSAAYERLTNNEKQETLLKAAQTCIALIIDKLAQYNSSMCRWKASGENIVDTFGRQALPMVWDFAEANPFAGASGDFLNLLDWHTNALVITSSAIQGQVASVGSTSATVHPYPDDSISAFITDPPYYDSVPYAYLSDFFYVWLRRALNHIYTPIMMHPLVPKDAEIVVDRPHELSNSTHNIAYYEGELTKAFKEGCRIVRHDGIGVIVFASKTTSSWEAILKAVVDAGWTITGSWPIDTEMETRVAAQGQARLASSVHLIVRPRSEQNIGDWRDVLTELPQRIHAWMPRLADEGVVGADAIFACLGPALEVFSRYSRVEKSSGEAVTLGEYLEHVWAAVSKEALSMIFKDPDTAGLEPDARLTAMWLWTLGANNSGAGAEESEQSEDDEADEESSKAPKVTGFTLEFDAARKIAQGLGVHLEKSPSVVEVKGDKAKLLSVAERVKYLFGKEAETAVTGKTPRKKKKEPVQQSLFAELEAAESAAEAEWGDVKGPKPGTTVLDRLHQAMVLFAAGRGEAMKRFIVEEGIGNDARFWKLAQSLTALYPVGSDEKRWVDGVLARKKGLGF